MDIVCTECGSSSIVQTSSDVVCAECGLVQKGSMSISEEYRPANVHEESFDDKETLRYPVLFTVSHPEGPQHLPQSKRRLFRTTTSTRAYKRKTGMTIEEHGKNVIHILRLPDSVADAVVSMYALATASSSSKDERKFAVMVACIHAVCAERGVTRSFKEVADASGVSKRSIIRESRALESTGLRKKVEGGRTSHDIIVRCVGSISKLGVRERRLLVSSARAGAEKCDHLHLQGKNPTTVAGALIWSSVMSLGYNQTQGVCLTDIELAVGIKKNTIRDLVSKIHDSK